jgi:hypothetical protein
VTVSLLLWCCGGNSWGIYYCLVQSITALFGVFECGPHRHLSYFKCKRKCKRKPRPWRKRAHKMQRRRSLAYHLVFKCRHRSGLRALDATKILSVRTGYINDGKRGMFDLAASITNDTNISSSLSLLSRTLYYITGAMGIMISPSCHVC